MLRPYVSSLRACAYQDGFVCAGVTAGWPRRAAAFSTRSRILGAITRFDSHAGHPAPRYLLSTPGLAYSFHVFANPDAWRMAMDQVHFQRLPEADFTVGERSYGVFYQDWRAMPPQAWLAALAEHELGD